MLVIIISNTIADEKRCLKLQKYEVFNNETLFTDTLVFVLPGHIEKASEDILIKACSYIAEQQDIPIINLVNFLKRKLIFSIFKSF